MDTGKQARLDNLKSMAEIGIIRSFSNHHWNYEILDTSHDGEYLIILFSKGKASFKIGYLYSCATANSIYKKLDQLVDLIVINDSFYKLKDYAYGISTQVIEKKDIQKYVIEWNSKAYEGKVSIGGIEKPKGKPKEFNSHIQSEQPINQIWSRIRQFKTKGLAKKLIEQRCNDHSKSLSEEIIESKSSGVAFCIQNACDYFEAANEQKLNQRIVSLYYGSIAFASAEMLASPYGTDTLQEVENMTKFGHGLFTFDAIGEGNDFEGFIIGVLSNGFFKHWIKFLGADVSSYPSQKPKKAEEINPKSIHTITLIELFSRIPELEDLFRMVTQAPTNWLIFSPSTEMNDISSFRNEHLSETYVEINDVSCSKEVEDIAKLKLPLEQIEYTNSEYPGLHFTALVRHPGHKYWYSVIKRHQSPFTASSYILPIFGDVEEYRCIATVILYALSILVRYRPSIWREVVSGKYENYLALTDEFLSVYERLAPEIFLEALLPKRLNVTQSGSLQSLV